MDKINPATKPVNKANGIKLGSANTVLTTPNPTYGKYSSGYKDGANAIESEKIFKK